MYHTQEELEERGKKYTHFIATLSLSFVLIVLYVPQYLGIDINRYISVDYTVPMYLLGTYGVLLFIANYFVRNSNSEFRMKMLFMSFIITFLTHDSFNKLFTGNFI